MAEPEKLLAGTVEEAKERIERRDGINYQQLLEAEKNGRNRESLKHFLKNRMARNEENKADDIGAQLEEREEKPEETGLNYAALSEKTVKELKQEVKGNDEIDLFKLLEAEQENQDRQVLINWIEKKIKGVEPDEEEEEIESSFEELEDRMKNVITDIKETEETDDDGTQDKIDEINEGVEEGVKNKGRTTKPSEGSNSGSQDEKDAVERKDQEIREEKVKELEEENEDASPTDKMMKKNHNMDSQEEYEEFQARIKEHGENFRKIREMLQKVIIGQEEPVEKVLIALMCDGNILLEGVPGLGKSLLVETLSRTISGTEMNRIQFVPDMLPSDILGQRVYNQEKGEFYINKGPVFANFLLADEINRAPPKTQAAMMEVMQEKKVSIEKEEFQLEPPYLVMATQNPLEQKGTYPLPEAVIDRFFMKLVLDYPSPGEEVEILQTNSIRDKDPFSEVKEVVTKEDILQVQDDVRNIYISPEVQKFIVELITTARGRTENGVEKMKYVDFGPSPRASIWLSLGASAYAILDDRTYVIPDDVKKIAKPILRHRVLLNYEGKISDTSTDDVIEEILENVDTV